MFKHNFRGSLRSFGWMVSICSALAVQAWALKPESDNGKSGAQVHGLRSASEKTDPFHKGFSRQAHVREISEILSEKWIGQSVGTPEQAPSWVSSRLNRALKRRQSSVSHVESRKDGLGNFHYVFQQYYQDIPLLGSQLLVHVNAKGQIFALTGKLHPDFKLQNKKVLLAEGAKTKGLDQLLSKTTQKVMEEPRLVILDDVLTWEVRLTDEEGNPGFVVFLNAETGDVIHQQSLKLQAAPTTNGIPQSISGNRLMGEDGSVVTLNGWAENTGSYFLYSFANKWGVYDEDRADWSQYIMPEWGTRDPAAISLASNMEKVVEYVRTELNWDSYNNLGTLIRNNVHVGTNYVNAYWNGSTLNFGDGDGVSANALTVLDVAAHEFGHAITEYTSDLVYSYESGALNESYSDILSAMVEFHYQEDGRAAYPNKEVGKADYLMGEDCWLESVALRDMRDPRRFSSPSYYRGSYWYSGSGDNGGVHYNSGVQNFAFYLLAEGGLGTNDGHPYDIQGLGIVAAGKIAMYANMYLLTTNSQYRDAREAWILAAQTLGYDAVTVGDVWTACGVFPALAMLVVNPAAQDMGIIGVGQAVTIPLTLSNQGNAIAQITSIEVNDSEVQILNAVPFTIASAQSIVLNLRWTPSTTGTKQVLVTINSTAVSTPIISATINAVVGSSPVIEVIPDSLFATLNVGQSSIDSIMILNHGEATLNWTMVDLISTTPPMFNAYGPAHYATLSKGDQGLRGYAVQGLQGGPDAFGYKWIDSDQSGGPAFTWTDIKSTGTMLSTVSSCDDCYQSVNFAYSFYGVNYTTVFVSSNGLVTFGTGNSALSNSPLPSTSAPRPTIAALWDDLNPATTGGDIYVKELTDRLIIQWDSVAQFGNSAARYTFQIQLLKNGSAELLYKTMSSSTTSTVGFQNALGTIGMTIAYNASYVKNNLRVQIANKKPWFALSQRSGSTVGMGRSVIPVQFDASDVVPGVYLGSVQVSHNDLSQPTKIVPIRLTVNGCKSLELSAASVYFDTVEVGMSAVRTVYAKNLCSETTTISEVNVPGALFRINDPLPLQIGPRDSVALHFEFLPTATGLFQTLVSVNSDASNSPEIPLTLSGFAKPAGPASYQITSIAGVGGSISPLGITSVNRGDSLRFVISAQSGFVLDSLFVNGLSVSPTTYYTFRNVQSNQSISAKFRELRAIIQVSPTSITESARVGQAIERVLRITNSGNTSLIWNATRVPTWASLSSISGVVLDSMLITLRMNATSLTPGVYRDSLVINSNATQAVVIIPIQFTVLANTFTISASAGVGGSITPSGITTVNGGDSLLYQIVPATGYRIDSVKVNGVSVGTPSTYTFRNVQANATIAVKFAVQGGGNCVESAKPVATNWVFRNAWGDQSNGSSLRNTETELEVVHRPWGKPDAWLIQTGVGYDFIAGQSYTVSFDFKDHATARLSGMSFALASGANWDSPAVVGTVMAVPGTFSSASFTRLTVNLTAPSTGRYYVAFQQRWASQPSVEVHNFYKNLSVCGGATQARYAMYATAGVGGTITPSGSDTVSEGANRQYIIRALSGYRIDSLMVDGVTLAADTSYTFTNIRANHTIRAYFSAIPRYVVYATAGVGGTITPSGSDTVIEGASREYLIQVLAGYRMDSLLVDGVGLPADTSYTFTNIRSNHTIRAYFSAISRYVVYATAGEGGTITPSGSDTVIEGASREYLIQVLAGYRMDSLLVDGVGLPADTSYTFTNIRSNHTIRAYFSAIPRYVVYATAGEGGTITPSGSDTVIEGASREYLIQVLAGYRMDSLLVDGVGLPADTSYTFTNIRANHTIRAYFSAIPRYVVYATAGIGGTITPSGSDTVIEGASREYLIQVLAGYRMDSILVDGVGLPADTSYTFTNIRANHTIRAYFSAIPRYVVYATAGEGGTITPSGSDTVIEGASREYLIQVLAGYRMDSLLVDGVGLPADTSYTFTNIRANHTIRAYFSAIPRYVVYATAGVGGTITPAGYDTISEGASRAYVIQALTGYRIASLVVDGVTLPTAGSYTFTNIRADHSIEALFTAIPRYVMYSTAGVGGTITPAGYDTISEGGSRAYVIQALTGYRIASLVVDGVTLPAAGTYSFTNIRADHSIRAEFSVVGNTCTAATAVDLGGFGTETRNLPGNACVKVSQYPTWWNNTYVQLGTITGGTYPLPYTWQNCSAQGSGTFTGSWQTQNLQGLSKTCPTVIQLQGSATQLTGLRWY